MATVTSTFNPEEAGIRKPRGCTPRIRLLRDRLVAAPAEITSERAVLVTESYRETEAEQMEIRRAKALDRILRRMTIFILDGEMIVGHLGEKHHCAPVHPEVNVQWVAEPVEHVLDDAVHVRGEVGGLADPSVLEGVLAAATGRSSWSMAVRRMGELMVRAPPDLLITSIWSGGTALMISTPPAMSSAIWVACSGMMRTRTFLKCGLAPQ